MVLEVNIFFLFPAPVLYVEHTDEVRRPASYQSVEYLKYDSGEHTQLRE